MKIQSKTQGFNDKKVLITGGLGFIGSNLAIKLVKLGAKVSIIDNLQHDHGANFFNIESIKKDVEVNLTDVRDEHIISYLVKDKDFVFHMAGQVSHVLSISNPFPDIDINIKGTAVVMEALKNNNPNAVLIYGGTRGQYGKSLNPAKETDTSAPTGIHEISHLAAEQIITTYNRIHKIPAILARMSNVYGPRSQMKHDKYGVVNWFIRLAIENKTIPLFSQGQIIRDFIYIDDCVNALITLAQTPKAYGKIFNIASGKPTKFINLTNKIIKLSGSGNYEYKKFTFERKSQEPGDFWADITKILHYCEWYPQIGLTKGLRQTIEYYKKYKKHYF